MKRSPKLLFLLWLWLPLSAHAAPSQAPITIEADRLEIRQAEGRSHYQGQVELQQGDMQLQSDSLQIEQLQGELRRAIADGKPVRLRLPDEETGQLIRAEADHVDYQFTQQVIELKGSAVLWRGGDEFRGEHLIYHIEERSVQAFGQADGSKGDGRVRIILQPEGTP